MLLGSEPLDSTSQSVSTLHFVQAHIAKASAQERAAAMAEAAAAAASAEAAAAALAETDAVREEWRQSEAALAARHEAELQSTDERWQRKLQDVRSSCRFRIDTLLVICLIRSIVDPGGGADGAAAGAR